MVPGGKPVSTAGIGQELLYMVIMALIYQIVLILIEYGSIQNFIGKICKTRASVFTDNVTDDDVLKESQRIKTMVANG